MKEIQLDCPENPPTYHLFNVSPKAVLSWGSEPDAFSCHNTKELKIGFVRHICDSNKIIVKQCNLSDWEALGVELPKTPLPDDEAVLILIKDYLACINNPGQKYTVIDFENESDLLLEVEKLSSDGFQINSYRNLPTGMFGWQAIKHGLYAGIPFVEEKILRYPYAGVGLIPEYQQVNVRTLYQLAVDEDNLLIGIEFKFDEQNKFIGFIQYQKESKKSLIRFCPTSELLKLSEIENELFYRAFDGRLKEVQGFVQKRYSPPWSRVT